MKSVRLAVLLFVLAAASGSASELAGLWTAKKRFGPDTHGSLILMRSGGSWTADLAGRTLPVDSANAGLTFSLPEGGTFRGKLDDKGTIRGHWLRPGTALSTVD